MRSLMQKALDEVLAWGDTNGLVYNPDKTTVVMFESGRKFKNEPALFMQGKQLTYSQNMKYLGVTLNKRLSWRPHIQERVAKCSTLLGKVRHIVASEWGLTAERLLWIHKAVALPRLSYGALVWANDIPPTYEILLDRVQRKTLLAMTRALRTSPTRGLEVLMGLPPIRLHLQEQATRAWSRIRNFEVIRVTWDGTGGRRLGHRAVWEKILTQIPITTLPDDTVVADFNWPCQPSSAPPTDPELIVYADGSGNEGRAGCGWAVTADNFVLHEGKEHLGATTVFKAEITAISRAMEWVARHYEGPARHVQVLTDCMAAKQALESRRIKDKTVWETACLKTKLSERGFDIRIDWTKAHANTTGNEFADCLAKEGAAQPLNMSATPPPIALSEKKRAIRNHFDKEWQKEWSHRDDCAHSRAMLPTVDRGRQKFFRDVPIPQIQRLAGAVTGHGLWGHHLSKFREFEEECKLCREGFPETPLHL